MYKQTEIKNMYVSNPSTMAGCDTRSGFKWNKSGLNSKFSFSSVSCLTKAKESYLLYYFTHSWGKNRWIHAFLNIRPNENVYYLI